MRASLEAPEVSVLTPSSGYGRFIADAIESVVGQENLRVEHVVQDACSTDSTIAVLERYGASVTWVSEPDTGQSDALNRALARARGEWIGWLNADEFYLPGALQRLVQTGRETKADVVYGEPVIVDEAGRLLRTAPQHPFEQLILRWYGVYISSCAMVVRRAALPTDPWRLDLRMLMDWELYLRLSGQGCRFVHLPASVAAFRLHPDQVTAEPARDFAHEFQAIRARYGIPNHLFQIGRVLHGVAKLRSGAYGRQLAARRLRGSTLRWFADEEAPSACGALGASERVDVARRFP